MPTKSKRDKTDDGVYRTSLALRRTYADRLLAILTRRDVTLAEQLRRWIALDEWITERTAPDADVKLMLQHPDGSLERVQLVFQR